MKSKLTYALFPVLFIGCASNSQTATNKVPSSSVEDTSWVQTDLEAKNLTQVCGNKKIDASFNNGELTIASTQAFGELCSGVFYGNNLLIGLGKQYKSSGFEFSYEAQVQSGKGLEIDAFTKDSTYHVGTKFRQNGQIMFHAARNPTTFGLIDEGSIGSWAGDGSWTKIHVAVHEDNTFSVFINGKLALSRKAFNYGDKTITHLTLLASDLGGKIRNMRHKGRLAKN